MNAQFWEHYWDENWGLFPIAVFQHTNSSLPKYRGSLPFPLPLLPSSSTLIPPLLPVSFPVLLLAPSFSKALYPLLSMPLQICVGDWTASHRLSYHTEIVVDPLAKFVASPLSSDIHQHHTIPTQDWF